MANIRSLKKELSLVLEIVIQECNFTREIAPDCNKDIDVLVEEAITTHNNVLLENNAKETVSNKTYFRKIKEDYTEKMIDILQKLDSLHSEE